MIALPPQSLICLALAVVLIAGARAATRGRRVGIALVSLGVLLAMALAVPLTERIRMGDVSTYTSTRENFEMYMGVRTVRFEAHLSTVLLPFIDRALGATADTPARAFVVLSRMAAAWYLGWLLVAVWVEGFSPAALRYAGLCVAAPVTLLYFGYRELGYLSLNAAAYPLIAAGLRRVRGRLEAGCALAGLGAALHGFGVLALAGAAAAAAVTTLRASERIRLIAQAFAYGTSFYLAWVFVDIVVLKLQIIPGHAESIPWRPLLVSTLAEHRVNFPILSARGAADLAVMAWMTGVPLVALVAVAAGRGAPDARGALAYTMPSLAFLIAFWPIQGVAVEADLVFAAFPAIFALIWIVSSQPAATWVSLALLASAHVVFWAVMLGNFFVNSRVS